MDSLCLSGSNLPVGSSRTPPFPCPGVLVLAGIEAAELAEGEEEGGPKAL